MEEQLSKYLHVIAAYSPSAMTRKNKFTFLSKKTGIPQAYLWDGNTAKIQPFGEFNDRVMSVYHSPTGDKTVVGIDHNGNEKQQFYLVSQNGKKKEPLIISPEHFHHFGGWSTDEHHIVFSSNRRNSGYFDLFVLNMQTRQEQMVFEYDGNCVPICWLKDSKKIVIRIQETNIDHSLYILDIETKELVKIGPKDVTARFTSLVLSEDGQTAFVLSDFENDTLTIYHFSLEQPEKLYKVIEPCMWDIEELALSPDEAFLLYTINEGGTSKLHIFEFSTNKITHLSNVRSGVIDSLSWLDQSHFVFALKSPIMPGDIWMYDLRHKEGKRITHDGASPDIEHLWVEPELCTFTSFDGLKVPYFYYSKEKIPKAAVVYVHGGPEHQIRAEFHPVIQYLVSKGFAVAAPNVRGSMGYGRKYVQLDDRRKRMDAVADLANLAEALATTKQIKPNKIGIMGRSYGGFMVLASLTHYPTYWAAGIDIVGISHFKTFLENTGPWRRRLREYEYGFLEEDADFFEEIAPLNHLEHIKAPLLVFHGRNDTRVPVSEAEQLTNKMFEMGKEVELVIFENEGHQTEKIENHLTMNRKIVAFFNWISEKNSPTSK
ncbi:S9 family peptidase [Bacillus chungangensis]|uniref:Dipeptidyl aminopeptidase/acylaminoacyl peptidase n=1 Tax=Bacillus chungangensis TaxID=587633 RepID=A0ABT9WXH2_9BACI|nr:S9 family peptidase [Bacillus chungangensis]MDQ0177983.1 dipeptidyl aminopeptidase/acylaminoacyl peptidase [Bacillus chungangensis]